MGGGKEMSSLRGGLRASEPFRTTRADFYLSVKKKKNSSEKGGGRMNTSA